MRSTSRQISAATEDYLTVIYRLQVEDQPDRRVSASEIAARLGANVTAVSMGMRRLQDSGLVSRVPYRGVVLTDAGRSAALAVLRRQRLLELFLVTELGLDWGTVHDEADALEHVVSDRVVECIAVKLGNPCTDPHGDPIPGRDLKVHPSAARSLQEWPVGSAGRLVRVPDRHRGMLDYLARNDVRPGQQFRVVDRQPFDGPTFVAFDSRDALALGADLARAMLGEELAA